MTSGAPRPTILLIGANGQLGWELARTLAPLGRVVAPTRAQLDLADGTRVRAAVRDVRPQIVVNAAAYTAVDQAEREAAMAHAVNGVAPGILAEEAARLRALIVHYSTDYVFDGTTRTPYTERDEPNPLNVYGETKLAGERAIAATGAAHLIFRTAWVYGLRRQNFLRSILGLAHERTELRVVEDQVGAPTWSRMIAEGTALALAHVVPRGGAEADAPWSGLYHLTAAGQASRFELAKAILERDPRRGEQRCRSVVAIRSDEHPAPARRPNYSALDSARAEAAFGVALPGWLDQLEMVLGELDAADKAAKPY